MFAQLINRIQRNEPRNTDGSAQTPTVAAEGADVLGDIAGVITPGQRDLIHAAIDWVDAPLVFFDAGFILQFANAAYCQLIGRERDQLIGQSVDELSLEGQTEITRAYFERALAGESLDIDVVHRQNGAIEGASRFEYRPQRDRDGRIVGVLGVMHRLGRRQSDQDGHQFEPTESSIIPLGGNNISAPMRVALRIAQDDVIERERKQKEQIESLPLPFVFIGGDGLCKWANQAFCDAFDISEQSIAGTRPGAVSSAFAQIIDTSLARASAGEKHSVEKQLASGRGAMRWHRIDFVPGFDRNGFQNGVYVLVSDIHESRVATTMLQESEAHFRGFTESIPEAIVFLDRDLRYRSINQSALKRHGMTRPQIIGHSVEAIVGPKIFAQHRASLARALKGEAVTAEVQDDFGRSREWRELRYLPVRGEGGEVEGLYIISRSLEEEKRAQRALSERDERIRFLTDNLPAQVCYVDTSLRYQYCNQRFLSDYGMTTLDDVVGKTPQDIFAPEVIAVIIPHIEAALRGERVQFERRATGNPNDMRWLRITLVGDFAEDGTARGIYAIGYDITDSKIAEDTRARQQQWIEAFIENFPQPLTYIDPNTVHQFSNRAYADFIGRPKDEIIGRSSKELFGRDLSLFFQPSFERALRGERMRSEHELPHEAAGHRFISIDWLPDLDASGTTRGIYFVAHDISEAKQALLAYEESIREMQRAMDSVAFPITFIDAEERIRFVNQTATTWHGLPAEMLIGMPMSELMTQDDYRYAEPYIHAALEGEAVQYEREMSYQEGVLRWVLLRYVPRRDEAGVVTGFYTTATDIQSRKKQEIALQQANSLLTAHFENTPLASFTLDGNGRVTRWSSQAEALFGWRRDEVFERSFGELGLIDADLLATFLPDENDPNTVVGNTRLHVVETRRRDGSGVTCEWHIAAMRDGSGRITSSLALIQDVSQRVEAERRLTEIAQRDTLTRLLNRNALEPTLRAFIERARQTNTGVAVLFLDLDHFKNINDTLGHRVGDLMLVEIAAILRHCVRAEDEVARIGGDEFMVVIGHARPKAIAHETAQRIIAALGTPIRVENQRLSVAASIGIAVYPDHGRAPESLVRSADLAMYRAKENGKNRFEFFSAMLAQRSERRSAVKGALKLALHRDALRLYFQPRVRIADNRIVGAEALLRWTDPRLGVVSPKEFIGIAEESGLIHELGLYVFRKACRQLREWQERGVALGVLSINFSAHQLLVATFIDEVDRVIEETGVDPRFIEVEITETSMLFDLGVTRNVIADLKHRGMRIAIDDFGTGFSSLSHLQQLDVDTLKIDQSFIRNMLHDAGDAAITTSVISLARGLKLSTTAEGVENELQLQLLRDSGCDYYQGFLFSPAIVVEDIEALLDHEHSMSGITRI